MAACAHRRGRWRPWRSSLHWGHSRPHGRREKTLVPVGGGYVGALAVLAVMVPQTANQPLARRRPGWTAPSRCPSGTKVLEEKPAGSFLTLWRFPQLDVVAHGYGDTYTDERAQRNADIDGNVRCGLGGLVKDTDVSYAVLEPDSPLGLQPARGRGVDRGGRASKDLEMLAPPPGWMNE